MATTRRTKQRRSDKDRNRILKLQVRFMKLRAERALEFARKVGQVTHPGSTTSARSISEWGGFFIDLLIHLILCGQLENELNDLTDFVRDHATQLSDADYEKLENAQANLLNLYAENC